MDNALVTALKEKRQADGLSIRSLSDLVGVSFSSLARIERGEGSPDNNTLARLLEWLGPLAQTYGLQHERVASVHFRAAKSTTSLAVKTLMEAAHSIKAANGAAHFYDIPHIDDPNNSTDGELSKIQLERLAKNFRNGLGLNSDQPLDPMKIDIEGVQVEVVSDTSYIDPAISHSLMHMYCSQWSAMSVPLDANHSKWIILLNDCHSIGRQRVTLLEEYWHILLGHKLTKIVKIANVFGRTYDKMEENNAYYLAAASLIPRDAIVRCINSNMSWNEISDCYGTSTDLVGYRLKRLGLWQMHLSKEISYRDDNSK